jgi:hypothetical protein
MSKKQIFKIPFFSYLLISLSLLVGSCLNPINFSEDDLPRIPVDVTGSLEVSVKDVAVLWLINRTRDVDVTQFTISRTKAENETDEQYAYPRNYTNRPLHGSSLASYHAPTEIFYNVTVAWQNIETEAAGYIEPLEVQFPRAADYKYYLYWTINGDLVLVNEDKMRELQPDPNKNFPDPAPNPSSINAQTFVVLNAAPDQHVDTVEFVKSPYTYAIANEPKAKDQEMILLGSGSYETTAYYTREGTRYSTDVKTAIVTREDGSMAVRTNYLYFYKTTSTEPGQEYQLTQTWPPIPNDASEVNKPEDTLLDTQGILKIINNATPSLDHDLIARININGTEYPSAVNTSNYMGPGESRRYILDAGTAHVSFRPVDQSYYGQTSVREIKSREITILPYTNNMGNPFAFPEDNGKGTGLIRITNNTTGVVRSVIVYDKADISKSLPMGWEDFNPPLPINYGKVGMVPVVGTDDVPLNSGVSQLIQVVLDTAEDTVVIERVAALKDQIVNIVISQDNLSIGGDKAGGRRGSKVVVRNNTLTPTNILGIYVYNQANVAASAVYALDIPSPNPSQKELYVLSTTGLPIVEGANYKARLSVYGNGLIAVIDKDFSPDNKLYSTDPANHVRHITLEQADLPSELVEDFKPVTGITISPSPYPVNSITESSLDGSNKQLKIPGAVNLNHTALVAPAGASKRSPITWTVQPGGGSGYVSLDPATSVLTVTGIAPEADRTVTLGAAIEKAAGTVTAKSDFSTTIRISLAYQNVIRTIRVTGITLSPAQVEKGSTLDLKSLVTLNPDGANINGVPITAEDLIWTITGTNTTGSSINDSILTAGGTAGAVTVQAALPAAANGGTSVTKTVKITIVDTSGPAFVPVTGITTAGSPLVLPFYTKTNSSGTRSLAGGPHQMNLTSYLVISPANATVQSPVNYHILSTTAPGGTVVLQNDNWLSVTGLANHNDTVKVKATIPGAISDRSGDFSYEFTVTLEEHNSRLVEQGELKVGSAAIQIGQSLNLGTLATLPAKASVDSPDPQVPPNPIAAEDLTWTIYGGTGKGTLSGATITGTSDGTVLVRATLPAARNGQSIGGTTVTAEGVITVNPSTSSTITLRIIKLNDTDYVNRIVLVPRTSNYTNTVYRTGHTKAQWALNGTDPTFKAGFQKLYPNARYYTIKKLDKTGDWADISIPWPANSATGYDIFFIEGDSRIRGYANPGVLSPPRKNNFLFFLYPEYLYPGYLMRMNGTKQADDASKVWPSVLPIGYDSYNNTASIMKSKGVGVQPAHDLSDF